MGRCLWLGVRLLIAGDVVLALGVLCGVYGLVLRVPGEIGLTVTGLWVTDCTNWAYLLIGLHGFRIAVWRMGMLLLGLAYGLGAACAVAFVRVPVRIMHPAGLLNGLRLARAACGITFRMAYGSLGRLVTLVSIRVPVRVVRLAWYAVYRFTCTTRLGSV